LTTDEFLTRLQDVRQAGDGWTALCPAHGDQHRSLSVGTGTDGRILINCHAGCSADDIVEALHLAPADLFLDRSDITSPPQQNETAIHYPYHDRDGNLLYEKVRGPGKRFYCRRPIEGGGWSQDTKGIDKPLYQLPEVIAAREAGQLVYIVEGEKDVETARAWGLTATTPPHGSNSWRTGYAADLNGASLVLIPDQDEPGRALMSRIVRDCFDRCPEIRWIDLPAKDLTDWRDKHGGNMAELEGIVSETRPMTREDDPNAVQYLDLDSIRRHGIRPPRWILEGWLAEKDIALFAGGGGIGKSTTAMDLAIALSLKREWCGIMPPRTYRVIYYDEEMDEDTTGMTLVRLGAMNGNFHAASGQRMSLYGEDAIQRLEVEIERHKPEVLVFDSIQQTFGPIEENSASDVGAVYSQIFRLRDLYDLTFVLVHHKKKAAPYRIDALEMIRGSTAHGTQSSTVWYAMPGDTANTMKIIQAKRRRSRKISMIVRYEEDSATGPIRLIGEGPARDMETQIEKCSEWLIDWLSGRERARTREINEAAESNDFNKKTVERALRHLKKIEAVHQPKRGWYAVPPTQL